MFDRDGYRFQHFSVLRAIRVGEIAALAHDLDENIQQLRHQWGSHLKVFVISWTRCNRTLLGLPLLTTGDYLVVRASGPEFARRLLLRQQPRRPHATRSLVEDLVESMRRDGRHFLVQLDRWHRMRPLIPSDGGVV